ncbi:leucine efflux protein LeuE [Collimonas sp. H4R21]|jgi:threonine/homoserine/homoserine lactone efflux protein|uniref:Leucine efflux protein LeuE n=1 Tax=Collimonas rhizosphaerae TaxID=3126357 RepID=A0ABU9PWT1_9BURK|nr:leucine efflux protein LeuE [Collimonas sp. OK412]SFC28422.1 Threonine/homoserine/homoserine lactone efflux protein [Collimonas sp. OK412]
MTAFFHALGITDVWQLIVATMVFLALPGAGTFCILTSAGREGVRGGYASLFGIMLGDAVLMFLAAIGVAALLTANPLVFKGVQYLGAAYLAYLGCKLLFARKSEGASAAVGFAGVSNFTRGFLVTLINPKAIVFYMAFFPLFIDPAAQRGSLTFLTMAAIISSCALFYGSLLVLLGNTAAKRLGHNRRIAAFASKAAGIFLIGFGIKLTTN